MSSIPIPGSARITLAALAIVPAALAYPWHSTRAYWLIGIAAAAVIVLFGWWRGLHFTTILGRRLAIMGRGSNPTAEPETQSAAVAKTTALVRIGPSSADGAVLPLELIARYLDRYGIHADKVRITSRDNASDVSRRETWIGITVSAADNLPALQARSSRIPLYETAEVAARRLADHLREIGWEATTVTPDDVPRWLPVWADRGIELVRWGCRRSESRVLPATAGPGSGRSRKASGNSIGPSTSRFRPR